MNAKRIVAAVLLAVVAASVAALAVRELRPASSAGGAAGQAARARVVACYFHPTKRCAKCLRAESVARKTLEAEFPAELSDGRMEWQALDYEEPSNQQFVADWKVTTSTLVVVEFRNGTPGRWKNLEGMWDFIPVEDALADYVRKEVRAFVRGH